MSDDCCERVDRVLADCGARSQPMRDLLRPLAQQVVVLEVDLSERMAHDLEYLRLLKAYEGALQLLRRCCK